MNAPDRAAWALPESNNSGGGSAYHGELSGSASPIIDGKHKINSPASYFHAL
jgi:hypothetical protein